MSDAADPRPGAPDGDAAPATPVTIELRWGGPLVVRGPVVIELADGSVARRGTHASLCRCGFSRNMPFCDGTHAGVGFRGE